MTTGRYSIDYKSKKINLRDFDPQYLTIEVKKTGNERKIAYIKYKNKTLYFQTPLLKVNFGSYKEQGRSEEEEMEDNTQHDITVSLGTEEQRQENEELGDLYNCLEKLQDAVTDYVKQHNDEFQIAKKPVKKDPDSFVAKKDRIIKFDPEKKDLNNTPYPPTIKFKIQKRDGQFQDRGFSIKVMGKDRQPRSIINQKDKEQIIKKIRGTEIKCMLRPAYFNFLSDYVYLTINVEQILVRSNQEEQSNLSDNEEDSEQSLEQTDSEQEEDDDQKEESIPNISKEQDQDQQSESEVKEKADDNDFQEVQNTPVQASKAGRGSGRKPGVKQNK